MMKWIISWKPQSGGVVVEQYFRTHREAKVWIQDHGGPTSGVQLVSAVDLSLQAGGPVAEPTP